MPLGYSDEVYIYHMFFTNTEENAEKCSHLSGHDDKENQAQYSFI